MKTLISILTLVLALGMVSCTSIQGDSQVLESDTGRLYKADHLDQLRGMASGKRDAEQMRFADTIIAKAGKAEVDSSGTFYPGTVKVFKWDNKYTVLRLVRCADGTEFWQGPNPPSGFYGSKPKITYLD